MSLLRFLASAACPDIELRSIVAHRLDRIDFNQILMRGMLARLISVAMALPPFPARDLLMSCTYSVVVFSILVQGTTVRRVLVHYGVGAEARSS